MATRFKSGEGFSDKFSVVAVLPGAKTGDDELLGAMHRDIARRPAIQFHYELTRTLTRRLVLELLNNASCGD